MGQDKKIAELVIALKTNTKELKTQLAGSQKHIKAFTDKSGKLLKSLASQWKKVAIAGTAAAIAFFADMKMVANAGDEFAKMSKKVGISTETLSAWKHVAELSGTTIDIVAGGLKRFSKNVVDLSQGAGEAKDSFDKMGISATDSSGRIKNMDDLILEISDKFKDMADGTEKTAIAMEIFGRAGTEMIPMLNAGSEGIREMIEEARRLGIVWSEEDAKAAEDFNDNLLRLKRTLGGINQTLMKDIIPVFTLIIGEIAKWIQANKDLMSLGIKDWLFSLLETLSYLPAAFFSITEAVKKVTGFFVGMAQSILYVAEAYVKLMKFTPAGLGLKVFGVNVKKVANDLKKMRAGLEDVGVGLAIGANESSEAAQAWADHGYQIRQTLENLKKYKAEAGKAEEEPEEKEEPTTIPEIGVADRIKNEIRKAQAIAGTELVRLQMAFDQGLTPLDEYWRERIRLAEEGAQREKAALATALIGEGDITKQADIETSLFEQKQAWIQERIQLDQAYTEAKREEGEKLKKIEEDIDKKKQELADKETKRRLAQLENYGTIAGGMADIFQNLYEMGSKHNKTMFYLAKAAALSEAIINVSLGMTKALGQGGVYGLILAGVVAAAGAIQIATIVGQTLAAGGSVQGQSGSDHADNIPIMATANEFMQPVSSVKYYGKPVMEAMRRMLIPRELFSGHGISPIAQPAYAFASGGAVTPQPQQNLKSETTIINITDPRELDRYLAGPQGQNAILNVLSSRANKVRKILR